MMNDRELLEMAIQAALLGGNEILGIYGHEFDVEFKEDKSPLTLADKNAHDAICRMLDGTGLPVLSEEGKNIPYDTRKNWSEFWMVDPLDGTKEFIKRNGEFTVNIALIRENRAVMGIIFVPVSRLLYFASSYSGARKVHVTDIEHYTTEELINEAEPLPSQILPEKLTVVCSRSHMSPETLEFIENLKEGGKEPEFVSIGSSLKLCLVAEGKAHIYPRFGPTMEWDTAAGQAILEITGGKVTIAESNEPLRYNKVSLLNPWFIASRD